MFIKKIETEEIYIIIVIIILKKRFVKKEKVRFVFLKEDNFKFERQYTSLLHFLLR